MTNRFDESYFTGYHVMPAAVDFMHTYETLGVQYVRNPKTKWLTKELKDGIHIYHYPDRTIYRTKPGNNHACIPQEKMDAYLDYSVLSNPELYKEMGYRYVMISPHHMDFKKSPIRNPHLRLFADSGGFQIRQGVTDFVDPDVLVDFYNASTDVGIGLDVPLYPYMYDEYLARMSHVTSRNNAYIKARLNKDIAIYDVNHGMDLKDRKICFDVTEQYAPNDGIALAGTSSNARGEYGVAAHIINGVIGIAYILARSKDRYKTAHILGTTTPFFMFVFHLMTKSGFFPHITSDSSTYAQAAMMNTQLTSVPGQSILYRNRLPKGNVLYRSPCSCPSCALVGYSQHVMINARANMVHSLYHYAHMNDLLDDLANQWIAGTISHKEVESIVSPPSFNHRYFVGTMKFLTDLFASGFKKAYKNNEDFIQPLLGNTKQNSLFGSQKKVEVPTEEMARTGRILSAYEQWLDKREEKPRTSRSKIK